MKIPSVFHILKKHGVVPKKRLGQHFLAAQPTIEKIVNAADLSPEDTVLEIGSGLGVMTATIAAKSKKVVAVEKDAALFDAAKSEFSAIGNIEWINADILKMRIEDVFADEKSVNRKSITENRKIKVLGNLPYNISSPIIFWMLENRAMISSAVVMLQKEVALRIAAAPGGKDYGILSVLLQAHANCKRLFDVSPKNFLPPPEVISSIVKIDFGPARSLNARVAGKPKITDEKFFSAVVKAAFGKRRKTLRNALLGAQNLRIDRDSLDGIFAKLGLDGRRRPETLSVDEFAELANALFAHRSVTIQEEVTFL